ncbi:CheR family methyltransferase, partial [Nanoarchaeota archaeon]
MIQKNIMVVDDSISSRKYLDILLKKIGHSSTLIENGDKAVKILKENNDFDCIISDCSMPGEIDGIELSKFVNPLKIPFIFYTTSIDRVIKEQPTYMRSYDKVKNAPQDVINEIDTYLKFTLTKTHFSFLKNKLKEKTGLITKRLNWSVGLHHYLKDNPKLISYDDVCNNFNYNYLDIISYLTNNNSHFFRLEDQMLETYSILKKFKTQGNNSPKIISAGCSRGQEPYSIAMLARQVFKDDWKGMIYALDINNKVLEEAKEGKYNIDFNLSPVENPFLRNIVKSYAKFDDQNFYINDKIKSMVFFKNTNLIEPLNQYGADLIFCNYVLLYFDRETQKQVENNLLNALK